MKASLHQHPMWRCPSPGPRRKTLDGLGRVNKDFSCEFRCDVMAPSSMELSSITGDEVGGKQITARRGVVWHPSCHVPRTTCRYTAGTQGSVSHISNTDMLGPNQTSSTKNHSQSSFSTSSSLPERPDQPECQYYMRLGGCKYGSSCKYHHPKERNQVGASTIGPYGLPLRPGQPVCNFYSLYGSCKYGPACKFDHPLVGYYNYALPAYSIPDPSLFFPDQRSSHIVLASSESSPPAKTSRSPDQYMKPETSDDDVQDNEHVDPSPQTPPSHTSQLSQSPQNHTD